MMRTVWIPSAKGLSLFCWYICADTIISLWLLRLYVATCQCCLCHFAIHISKSSNQYTNHLQPHNQVSDSATYFLRLSIVGFTWYIVLFKYDKNHHNPNKNNNNTNTTKVCEEEKNCERHHQLMKDLIIAPIYYIECHTKLNVIYFMHMGLGVSASNLMARSKKSRLSRMEFIVVGMVFV